MLLQLLSLQEGKLTIVLTDTLYAKECNCRDCKAEAVLPFLFLPTVSESSLGCELYPIHSHICSQEQSKLCFECLKTRFVPQNYLLCRGLGNPPKSDLPLKCFSCFV